jgi:iron-sulfur cluster repair protein YtfE (RIC family)
MNAVRWNEDSIRDFFRNDHERLDRLFAEFRSSKRTNFARAAEAFRKFTAGLKRHIRWEEEVLFSAFETDDENRTSGPTAVMRAEHRKIEEALQRLDDCVRDGNPDCDEDDARLLEILQAHNFKEERVVYPLVDRMLGPAEKEVLLHRIHALASS